MPRSGPRLHETVMVIARGLITAIALVAFSSMTLASPAAAEDESACLTNKQRRAVIASGQVVPLATAIRAAHRRHNEVVKARLCRSPNGFVYLLTLLARDGKVTHVTVDAASGKLAEGR